MSMFSRPVRHRWLLWFTSVALSLGFLFVFLYDFDAGGGDDDQLPIHETNSNTTAPRRLLGIAEAGVTQRTGEGGCNRDDVSVYQGATAPLPNGIPTYTVEILNVCVGGCEVGNIHVSCGWFSSARLINPRVFRRLRFDDCLVNDGAVLAPGQSLSFQYANTYPYPLSVSSLSCY